jgi:hypothetical protein
MQYRGIIGLRMKLFLITALLYASITSGYAQIPTIILKAFPESSSSGKIEITPLNDELALVNISGLSSVQGKLFIALYSKRMANTYSLTSYGHSLFTITKTRNVRLHEGSEKSIYHFNAKGTSSTLEFYASTEPIGLSKEEYNKIEFLKKESKSNIEQRLNLECNSKAKITILNSTDAWVESRISNLVNGIISLCKQDAEYKNEISKFREVKVSLNNTQQLPTFSLENGILNVQLSKDIYLIEHIINDWLWSNL